MIIVVAKLVFQDQAARDRAVELSTPIQMATRNEEKGCQDYCFAPDPGVPNVIQVYELWDTGNDLVEHFKHPNYTAMVEVLGNAGIVESINAAYDTHKSMPVYLEDGSARDKFWDD